MIKHRRKLRSLRLKDYDYSQSGWYFVTVCTKDKREIFGEIKNETMKLNVAGAVVRDCWLESPKHYRCALGEFVVMPNYIHVVIIIPGDDEKPNNYYHVGAGHDPRLLRYSISDIVRGFKSASTRAINILGNRPGRTVWQRGFYDHIIRDEVGLGNITEYIRYNPIRWAEDRNNPLNKRKSKT